MVAPWPHGPHDGDHCGRWHKEGLVGLGVLLGQVNLLLLEGRLHLAETERHRCRRLLRGVR